LRHRVVIFALLALTALLGAGVARAELSQKGNLRISFNGSFAPRALPRAQLAPVTVSVEGAIGTTDGTRPPVLEELDIELNRSGRISTRGLAACTTPLLQSTTDDAALARCRPALVGHGNFAAALESGGKLVPAGGQILAFNGLFRGGPALLLHFYAAVPVRATLVLPLAISHSAKGRFGTILATRIPTLAGGLGSITRLKLEIGRRYGVEGQRRSFIRASCAAPAGFPGASFSFARGNFHFADGRTITTALTRNCTVRSGT
jgi:hypothetical protein